MGVGLWLFCATQKRYSVGRPRSHTSWTGRDSFGPHRLGDRGGRSPRSPRLRPSKRSAIRRRLGRHVGRTIRCARSASTAVRVTWNSRLCGVLPRGVAFARRTRALLSVREGSRANAGASNAGTGFFGNARRVRAPRCCHSEARGVAAVVCLAAHRLPSPRDHFRRVRWSARTGSNLAGTGRHALAAARPLSFVPKPIRPKELHLQPEDEFPSPPPSRQLGEWRQRGSPLAL